MSMTGDVDDGRGDGDVADVCSRCEFSQSDRRIEAVSGTRPDTARARTRYSEQWDGGPLFEV